MSLLSSCFGLLLQVLRLGICVVLLYYAADEYTNGQASSNWPSVKGKLTTAELKQTKWKGETKLSAEVKYDYVVNGRTYSADRVQFGGLGFRDPAKVIDELKSTKDLRIHYKPDHPDVASIDTGCNLNFIGLEILAALGLIALAVNDHLKHRRTKESTRQWNGDRQGKKLSSVPGLKEQKTSGLTPSGASKKNKSSLIIFVLLGCMLAVSAAIEHIEIPGIPPRIVGASALIFGGLFLVILTSLLPSLAAVLVRKRQFALAEMVANINAAIYSGFTSSSELALARGLQAEVAQERLQYDKAVSYSTMALNAMAERNVVLKAAAEQKVGVLEKQAMVSNQKQYAALESLCNESLGAIYYDMGKYDDALKHAKVAIKMAEDLLKDPSNNDSGTKLALACALALKGTVELALGCNDDARSDLKRAVTIRREENLPYHERLAEIMSRLASTYTGSEEYRTAERLLDESLQIAEESSGTAMQLAKATVQYYRADLKMHLGQYQSAQEILNQCIALREEFLVPNHPHIAEAYLLSSKISHAAGRTADASRLKEKASSMFIHCFGYKHPSLSNLEIVKSKNFSASI